MNDLTLLWAQPTIISNLLKNHSECMTSGIKMHILKKKKTEKCVGVCAIGSVRTKSVSNSFLYSLLRTQDKGPYRPGVWGPSPVGSKWWSPRNLMGFEHMGVQGKAPESSGIFWQLSGSSHSPKPLQTTPPQNFLFRFTLISRMVQGVGKKSEIRLKSEDFDPKTLPKFRVLVFFHKL